MIRLALLLTVALAAPASAQTRFAPLAAPAPLDRDEQPWYDQVLDYDADGYEIEIVETGERLEVSVYDVPHILWDEADADAEKYRLYIRRSAGAGAVRVPRGLKTLAARALGPPREASIEPGAGPDLRVRNAWITRSMIELGQVPEAAYYVMLIAGADLRGDERLTSAGKALCQQIAFDPDAGLDPEGLAIVAAPVTSEWTWGEDGATGTLRVALGEDYDFDLAAHWLETLQISHVADGLELGRAAFGFLASGTDPTVILTSGGAEEVAAANFRYLDLSALSASYVEELVERVVEGMRVRDHQSNLGFISLMKAFTVVEAVGDTTLAVLRLSQPSAARAAEEGYVCEEKDGL